MSDCVVLGAGMVGVSTALALQERGHSVILVDRRPPGREASYGNAGIIQLEVMEPYAFPRSLVDIAKIAFGMGNAVHYRPTALPSAAWPLWLYYRNSEPRRHAKAAAIYRQMITQCGRDHDRLIEASGSEHLIRRTGYLQMHRQRRALDADVRQAERYEREFGVAAQALDATELRQAEPALRIEFAGAVHWKQSRSCRDPGALVNAYADLFLRQGGTFLQAELTGVARSAGGWRVDLAGTSPVTAEHVVIALGAWSPELLKPYRLSVPMVRKRGYHKHFQAPEMPTRPLYDVAASALYCPMTKGLRVTTGAEIAAFGSAPGDVQLRKAVTAARQALDLGDAVEPTPWSGWRPCLPDMLPVVGAVPGQAGLWCNFGHGHQGFTLGPTTAQILAAKIFGGEEAKPIPELEPSRFA